MTCFLPLVAAAPIFSRSFAATEGWVKAPERPYRQDLCLNGTWAFQPVALPPSYRRDSGVPPELPAPAAGAWSSVPIRIPSPWNANRWTVQGRGDRSKQPVHTDSVYFPSYPRAWDDAEMGWLRRSFRVPAGWAGKRLRLRFEAVAGECQVFVNGKPVGANFDSFLPFEVDVTNAVRPGRDNELRVGVRAARLWNHRGAKVEAFRAPYPPGSTLDHIAGIWQDVELLGVSLVRVADTFVRPEVGRGRLEAEVTLRNDEDRPRTLRVGGAVHPWRNRAGKGVLDAPEPRGEYGDGVLSLPDKKVTVPPHGSTKVVLSVGASRLKTWTPSAPSLYGLFVDVREGNGTVDRQVVRFGWREFKIAGRDLLLNGQPIRLHGDLLHPFGPFIGSRRYAWAWYRAIKEMGGNAVRLHAQPMPRHFLDLADEMGLCVLDETALFGSSVQIDFDTPEAWRRFDDHYDRLVLRDRNHPSVFGWSCGNELFAMFFKVPEPERTGYYEKLKAYARRSYRLDPTRDWVSCDGDEDLRGGVPVWSRHYGIGVPDLPDVGKPHMIGESGGSYYAKPKELAELNGDRAYESYRGRNEALAIDLYRNVEAARKSHLAFFSASETAWFGLEHLPFGYTDRTRPPTLEDGIRFGPFREGEPGVQPERLPPYCMTLNPGFDPSLPLYRPLPMFEAFRAALAGRPLAYAKASDPPVAPAKTTMRPVAFAGERSGTLFRRLNGYGVPFAVESPDFLIVDGDTFEKDGADATKRRVDETLARGGTVLLALGADAAASRLLGTSFRLTDRMATSLIPDVPSDATAGLRLPDLYFAEDASDPRIAKHGLDGALVAKGKVLLRASDTDWTLFNDLSEEEKCSDLLIGEGLIKPSGAVLVEAPTSQGRLLVGTIDYASVSEGRTRLWRRLFENLGVALREPKTAWALPTALVDGTPHLWRYDFQAPGQGWTEPGFSDGDWRQGPAGFGTNTPGSRVRTPWTTDDVWLRTTFDLAQDELSELVLHVYHDEDVEVYVNGSRIYAAGGHVQSYQTVPLGPDARQAFRVGTNTIAVHCHQTAGGQYIDVGIAKGPFGGSGREYDPLREGPLKP